VRFARRAVCSIKPLVKSGAAPARAAYLPTTQVVTETRSSHALGHDVTLASSGFWHRQDPLAEPFNPGQFGVAQQRVPGNAFGEHSMTDAGAVPFVNTLQMQPLSIEPAQSYLSDSRRLDWNATIWCTSASQCITCRACRARVTRSQARHA